MQLGSGVGIAAFSGIGCTQKSEVVEPAAEVIRTDYGVQLYTVRELLPTDAEGTLKAIAEMGYGKVEISSSDLERLAPMLKDLGLSSPSGHFPAPLVTGNWEAWKPLIGEPPEGASWEKAVEMAVAHGMEFMVISYLLPSERGGLDYFKNFADQMNRAGEACRQAGLKLGYHNHAFEFQEVEGTSIFEILMQGFDPELVGWELDVFWSSVAGVDSVELFGKYPGRIPLVHLKDKPADAAQSFREDVPRDIFLEVGGGSLDIPAILAAAKTCGSKHLFVEQDSCPGSPLDSLRQSISYLKALSA